MSRATIAGVSLGMVLAVVVGSLATRYLVNNVPAVRRLVGGI